MNGLKHSYKTRFSIPTQGLKPQVKSGVDPST